MKQSRFDIIITGTHRSRVISFLRELIGSDDVSISDLYGSMIMSIIYGELNSVCLLNRNNEKTVSLLDIEDENEHFYNITFNNPNLKRFRFLNIDFDLLFSAEINHNIIQIIESSKLFLYVFPITADLNQEQQNIRRLSSLCRNGIPCLVIFTELQDQQTFIRTEVFPLVKTFTRDIGLNALFFIFAAENEVPEEIKYHFRHGKDDLWQVLSEYSNIKDSFVFGKQNETFISTLLLTIETVEKIIPKYNFNTAVSHKIQESIYVINRKCKDSNFYLGVIGEFTSGKSTLINALLKEDILTTSITQSTTCAATYISHSGQIGIKVKMNDGAVKNFLVKRKEDMKLLYKMLDDFTASENIASNVDIVELTYPFIGQDDYFTIIDTPGVNVSNERHLALTANIIKKECDAYVVVISAMEPMSHSLEIFIQNNLGEESKNCIFAITKLDLCKDQENARKVVQDITNKLKNNLKVSNPVVVLMTSILIMDELYKSERRYHQDIKPGFRNYLYQEFAAGEILIIKTLQENKMKLQYKKVNQIICLIYETLSREIKEVSDGLNQDIKIIFTGNLDEIEETKAFMLLKEKQLVNEDLKQLLECRRKLCQLGIPL